MRASAGLGLAVMMVAAGCAGRDPTAAPADGGSMAGAPPTTIVATTTTAPSPTGPPTTEPAPAPASSPMTSCRSVVHIGDSTSVGLVSPDVLADPERRMEAQYRRVGVVDAAVDASAGRSIVETLPGQQSGLDVAEQARAAGYQGCWVFALGTNDAANAAVGSNVGLADRIDLMMAVAGDDPVLWVNAVSQRDDGEWSEAEMERWNAALETARTRYPNLAIDEWDDVAVDQADWFVADGIHYTSAGNEARAEHIADALVEAYPA